jgi:hypothetical protein
MFSIAPSPSFTKAVEEKLEMTATLQWLIKNNVMTDGKATGGSASTLVDSTKDWTVDAFAGKAVEIYAGTGAGQTREVVSNTADTLTVTPDWTTTPGTTSIYEVRDE